MSLEEGIKLFAAFGFGTILSATISFFSSSRNNVIDFYKDEYQYRRDKFLSVFEKLDSYNTREIFHAIEQLKLLISPRTPSLLEKDGEEIKNIGKYYYLNDAHIWQILDNFDYSLGSIATLKKYIKLYIDYENDKTRNLITINTTNFFSILCKSVPIFISIFFMIFVDSNQVASWIYFFAILFIILSEIMISIFKMVDGPSEKVIKWLYGIFYVTPVFLIFCRIIFWNINLFESDGMLIVAVLILMTLFIYNFYTTFARIENYTQKYVDRIKNQRRT